MQCAQAYLNVHWSFIIIIIRPSHFVVQRTLSILQLHSESLRKWFTSESNELSSSECCWKENLQLKVAALTQQPKKWLNLALYQEQLCWNIKKSWSLKSLSKLCKIGNLKTIKKFEFCWHFGWNFVQSSHDFHMEDEEM